MLRKIGRILIVVMAVLVIVLSVGGIFGAWGISNVVSNVTLKVFSVVQIGVQVVDTAVGRVDALIQSARDEVQQTEETINTTAGNLQDNHPVLTALNERLETRLGPTVDKIQETLAPVHDVVVSVGNAVSFVNSIPFISERAPGLERLDQTLTRLSSLGADVKQLRTTLNTAVTEKADRLTQSVANALTNLTSRIDGGLAGIQSDVQALQSEITALQARIQSLQSMLLLIFDLIALLVTLVYIWVIYSQIVVIRHHWSRSNNAALNPAAPEPSAPTAATMIDTPPPAKIEAEETAAQPTVEANVETPPAATPDQPEKTN